MRGTESSAVVKVGIGVGTLGFVGVILVGCSTTLVLRFNASERLEIFRSELPFFFTAGSLASFAFSDLLLERFPSLVDELSLFDLSLLPPMVTDLMSTGVLGRWERLGSEFGVVVDPGKLRCLDLENLAPVIGELLEEMELECEV